LEGESKGGSAGGQGVRAGLGGQEDEVWGRRVEGRAERTPKKVGSSAETQEGIQKESPPDFGGWGLGSVRDRNGKEGGEEAEMSVRFRRGR